MGWLQRNQQEKSLECKEWPGSENGVGGATLDQGRGRNSLPGVGFADPGHQ